MEHIGAGAFSNCTSIQRLLLPKNYVLWNPNLGVSIDKCAFIDCVELTDVELGGYSKIEQGVFHGCRHLRLKISGRTVVDNEFTGTAGLSYVEYSNELLSVGSHSFARCASLKGVMMPSVTTLGQYAFSDCGALKSVKLPSIVTIGAWAFNECRDMSELELPAVLEHVEEFALNGCRCLERIAIPLKDNLISDNVFTDCDELIKVDLVGDVHETISAFFLESSRNDVEDQIQLINRELLQNKRDREEKNAVKENIPEMTGLIQRWIDSTFKLYSEKKERESKFLRQAFKGEELSSRSFFAPKLASNEEEHVGQKEAVMFELRQTIVKVAHDKPYVQTKKEKKREEKKKKKAEKERKKKEAEGAGGLFNSLSALAAGVFQSSS